MHGLVIHQTPRHLLDARDFHDSEMLLFLSELPMDGSYLSGEDGDRDRQVFGDQTGSHQTGEEHP